MSQRPKRVWITADENAELLTIDGFQARTKGSELYLTTRLLSMFPGIPAIKATLYDLNFMPAAGEGVAILGATREHLRDALLDLSSNHGLDLDMVEGLRETFPEGLV